jgi:hypothetical protein
LARLPKETPVAKDGRLAAACSRMRGRLTHAVIAGALLCALAFTSQDAQAAAPYFGVCYSWGHSPEQLARDLDQMASSGVLVVRRDASWGGSEPHAPDTATGEHRCDWRSTDVTAATLAAHGLTWYPILDYSAPWASTVPNDPMSGPRPDAVDDYAAYAAAFAGRYGRGGAFWAEHPELPQLPVAAYELGNEPNAEMFWHEQATAAEVYADEYVAARAAIKAVDARTPVVSAGLLDANATNPSVFLRRMVRRQPSLRSGIDAVGYHPYQTSYAGMRYGIGALRKTMKSLGLGKVPIEITEAGMTTSWVSESVRAEALGRLARTLPTDRKLNVTRFIPYEWSSSHQGADYGQYWGIMNADGSPTPTGAAYLGAIRSAPARIAKAAKAARARAAKARARAARAKARARRAA